MPLVNSVPAAPPRKNSPRTKSAPPPNLDKIRAEREDSLNGLFQISSAVLVAANQWADAGAINLHGPGISRETVKLADRYEKVGNALDALAQVGPFTAILGAVMPLVLQIAANHKRVPPEKLAAFGIKDPGTLEAQMRMEAQRQALAYQQVVAAEEKAIREEMQEWADLTGPILHETVPVE